MSARAKTCSSISSNVSKTFQRLEAYTEVRQLDAMKKSVIQTMVKFLAIFTEVTKTIIRSAWPLQENHATCSSPACHLPPCTIRPRAILFGNLMILDHKLATKSYSSALSCACDTTSATTTLPRAVLARSSCCVPASTLLLYHYALVHALCFSSVSHTRLCLSLPFDP
jgi:hypothetical protein